MKTYKDNAGNIYNVNDDGAFHNDAGPAIIWMENGKSVGEAWYHNGKRHREDGPALIGYHSRVLEWWVNGERHRLEGPAVIWTVGECKQRWYVNDVEFDSAEDHLEFVQKYLQDIPAF